MKRFFLWICYISGYLIMFSVLYALLKLFKYYVYIDKFNNPYVLIVFYIICILSAFIFLIVGLIQMDMKAIIKRK
ncbi:hypothetical protein KLEB273_gp256 [Bacillus phage vB_BauM_KLEB27-3]|nr:hypothetical protein KLEB273_gp256 [Bacillus phage vB_BauM_KLEB27-3]